MTDFLYGPLATPWPKPETKRRKVSPFAPKGGIDQIWRELHAELVHLKVREAALEFDMAPASFRKLDGRPFADTRGNTSKVLLRFFLADVDELQYACDTYHTWQGNLRAISLTLTALRAVDRYGATTHREQYRGFKALGAGNGQPPEMTPSGAARILLDHDPTFRHFTPEGRGALVANLLAIPAIAGDVALRAVKSTHPDNGGSTEAMARVNAARQVIQEHFAEKVPL